MNLFLWLFVAAIVIGIAILGIGLWQMVQSTQAGRWPVTDGTIVSCVLDESESSDDGGSTFEVKVEYEYFVDGHKFTNDRLAIGYSPGSEKSSHQEIFDRLENSKTVEVRYNPLNPQSAVISHGIHRSIQFILLFGAFWLVFCIGFFAMWWISSQPETVLLKNLQVRS